MPTNVDLRSGLEAGIDVILAPSGNPMILCSDGAVLSVDQQTILPADTYRAYLYARHAGFAAPAGRLISLGKPAASDDDKIVASVDMQVGGYTLTQAPDADVPRNILVTVTATGTADTLGTVVITGTDYAGNALTETLTPNTEAAVAGKKAFKTVTAVEGVGWEVDETEKTADKIKVGYGNEIGVPFALVAATDMMLGVLGTAITAHNPTVTTPASLSGTTVDMSAGTYNGTKEAFVFVKM